MMQARYAEVTLYRLEEAPSTNGITGKEQELDNGFITNVTNPSLLIYPAKQPNGKAIIMCPGGGLTKIAIGHEGHDMAPWFNEQGITFAILKYRMPNGNRLSLSEDIRQATRVMRTFSNVYGFNELGVMGASIGGYIAASAAVFQKNYDRPDFQILFYPVISMKQEYTHIPSRTHILGEQPSHKEEDDFSLEFHISHEVPKAFIVAASDDKAVSPINSTLYYNALRNHNIPTCLHIYPEGGHSFAFRDTFPYKTLLTEELKTWLNRAE